MQATYQTRIEGNDAGPVRLCGPVRQGAEASVCGGFFRQVRGIQVRRIDEEGLRQGIRHTGPDVQRGAGIPGGEGLGGAGVPASARRDPEGPGPQGRQGVGWRREEG